MAQEYLNLEEAASQLGVTKEELSKKAQRREIRAFADRGTWKFRKQDIEEHARQAGIGSGAEIVFGDLDDDLPALDSGSSDQILLSEQTLAEGGPGSSGARVIGMDEHGRTPSDSDVRLVPESRGKKGSDSDVKLVGGVKPPSDSDVKVVSGVGTDDSDSDLKIKGPAPGDSDVRLDRVKAPSDSGIRISPEPGIKRGATDVTQDLPVFAGMEDEGLVIKSGSSDEHPIATDMDSDFELGTSSDGSDDLDLTAGTGKEGTSSDSDMTLALDDNAGLVPDEIRLAPKGPGDSDVTAGTPSASGVNLGSPADSGIALDEAPPASKSGRKLGMTAGPSKPASDIFETDFEVPVLDSDSGLAASSSSDTEQLGGDSDFELSGSDLKGERQDSSSQVLSLEGEESVDESAATSLAASPKEEQWEEDLEGGGEFEEESGQVATARSAAGIQAGDESTSGAPALVPVGVGEAEWGGVWVGILSFSTLVMVLLGMVMLDLVRTMWGWDEAGFMFYKSPILNWMSSLLPK